MIQIDDKFYGINRNDRTNGLDNHNFFIATVIKLSKYDGLRGKKDAFNYIVTLKLNNKEIHIYLESLNVDDLYHEYENITFKKHKEEHKQELKSLLQGHLDSLIIEREDINNTIKKVENEIKKL